MKSTPSQNSLDVYLNELKSIRLLSAAEERQLIQEVQAGNAQAKEKFVRANLRFVVKVARRYRQHNVPLEDLISAGNLGLLMAIERFDTTRGYKFISYATWWIRNLILQTLSEQIWVVRLPANRLKLLAHLKKRAQKHPHDHADLQAKALGVTTEQLRDTLTQAQQARSLYETHGEKENKILLDVLPNDTASPDRETLEKDLTKHIQRALNALETREAMVLRLFFGFDTHPPQSLSAIGKKLDLSRERVRQIKKQALDRLNHPKRRTPLEDFLDTH